MEGLLTPTKGRDKKKEEEVRVPEEGRKDRSWRPVRGRGGRAGRVVGVWADEVNAGWAGVG